MTQDCERGIGSTMEKNTCFRKDSKRKKKTRVKKEKDPTVPNITVLLKRSASRVSGSGNRIPAELALHH